MRAKCFYEFLATYVLVFAGTGAVVVNELTKQLSLIGVALTFGLVVMAMVYTFGHLSGAHMNPAVTAGFWVIGHFGLRDTLKYILFKLLGAIAASLSIRLIFGGHTHLGMTLPTNSLLQSFILEGLLSYILMFVILSSAIHREASKPMAGLAIGATVALEVLLAGTISGASMNPARSLGPALVSGIFQCLWIYLTAPILGALIAGLTYKFMTTEPLWKGDLNERKVTS